MPLLPNSPTQSNPPSKKRYIFILSALIIVLVAILFTYMYTVYGSPFEPDVPGEPEIQPTITNTTTKDTAASSSGQISTIAQYILSNPETTIFADAIKKYTYDQDLRGDGPYTVFLPTNKAYENVPPQTADSYLNYEKGNNFKNVLNYHFVRGKYEIADFTDGMRLETEQGEQIIIKRDGDFWVINGYSYIEKSDIPATNGVVHQVTNFVFPPSMVN